MSPLRVRRTFICRLLVVLPILMGLAGLFGLAGCASNDRKMVGMELQKYKLSLVRESGAEISEAQKRRLMRHPGRTQAELDEAVDQMKKEYRARQSRDRSDWIEDHERLMREGDSRLPERESVGPIGPGALDVGDS